MAKIVDNCRGFEIEIRTAAVRQTCKRNFILQPDGVWIKEGDRTVAAITFPLGANLNYGLTLLQSRMERSDSQVARELISNLMTVIRSYQLTRFHAFSFFPAVHEYERDGSPDLIGSVRKDWGRLVVVLSSGEGKVYASVSCPDGMSLGDMEEYLRAEWLNCEGMNAVGKRMVDLALREIGRLSPDKSDDQEKILNMIRQKIESNMQSHVVNVAPTAASRPTWVTEKMADRLIAAAASSFGGFKGVSFGDMRFSVDYAAGTRIFELCGPTPVGQDEIVRAISLGISEHGDCCFRFANALIDSTGCDDVLEEADIMSKKGEKT